MAPPECRLVEGRTLTVAHITALAQLHCDCLPHSLFSRVGLGATRCLYQWMARSTSEIFLLAFDPSGRPCGAAVTSLAPHTLMRRLLLRSPLAFWLALRMHKLPWAGLRDQLPPPQPELPELMFLFVRPQDRQGGTGQKLVELTQSAVAARGKLVLTVMTQDSPDNRALGFYRRLGYEQRGTVRKFGKAFVLFYRQLV